MYKNLCLSLLLLSFVSFLHAQESNKNVDSGKAVRLQTDYLSVEKQKQLFPAYSCLTKFSDLLDGTVTGVQVAGGAGQPGADGEIRIRGPHSIQGGNVPLIILDGAPYAGLINSININDIESVYVIKDAEAAMIYGLRGANGVVEIVTKQAKDHKWRLTVDAKVGINNRAYPDYEVINKDQDYYETYWEAYRNALLGVGYDRESAGKIASGYYPNEAPGIVTYLGGYNAYDVADSQLIDPATGKLNSGAQLKYHDNWSKELQRTAMRHDYGLSAGKAGKKGDLFFSAGYLNDGGYIKHTGFERFNARLNSNVKITSWLKAGLNISGAGSTAQIIDLNDPYNPFYVSRNMAPIYPAYYLNKTNETETDPLTGTDKFDWGNIVNVPESSIGARSFLPNSNVLGTLSLDKNQVKNLDIVAIPYIEARFLKHFTFRSGLLYNYDKQDVLRSFNPYYGQYAFANGSIYKATESGNNYTWNQVLSWKQQIGNHTLSASLGHETFRLKEKSKYKQESFNGSSGSANPMAAGSAVNNARMESYFARLNYAFLDKYTFFAGIRRDGSSGYTLAERWSNNWSAGAAWFINKERCFENKELLNLLKLRLSYGAGGRSASYPAIGLSNLDIGLDFAFLKNRLSGQINFFNRKDGTYFVLMAPGGTNYMLTMPVNMTTNGLELGLQMVLLQKANCSWTMGLNLSHYKNRITQMPDALPVFAMGNYQLHEGGSVYDYYLAESAGVDHQNGDELYYYTDKSGQRGDTTDYLYALSGRVIAGSAMPDLFGGLSNSFSYKNIELAFRLNFSLGGKYYDAVYQNLMSGGQYPGQNWSTDILNRWTPENPDSDIPRVDASNPDIGAASTRFLNSASYLRIGRVMLTYHFSQAWVKQLKLSDLNVYLSADNLALFAARKGMDPQATFQGNGGYVYSPTRTILFGIHLGL